MQLQNLLPAALAILPLVNAYSNVAVRYENLLKRSNETYSIAPVSGVSASSALAPSQDSVSTSELTTEIVTFAPTTDANGQPSSVLTTSTITYYSTVTQTQTPVSTAGGESVLTTESAVETTDDQDSTLTSFILTTVTLPGESSAVSTTSDAQNAVAFSSSSADSLALDSNNKNLAPNAVASSSASPSTTDSPVSSSATAQGSVSTVTVTVTNDQCVPTTTTVITTKIPVTAQFTVTGSNGELYTVSTSTDIDQTTTQVVYLTQTTTLPSSSANGIVTTVSNADTTYTTTLASTSIAPSSTGVLYGNGTNASNSTGLSPSASQYSISASDYNSNSISKRSFLRRIIGY